MARVLSQPMPGWYRIKRAKGAVWTPVLIYRPCRMDPHTGEPLDRWYHLRALLGGYEEVHPMEVWPWCHEFPKGVNPRFEYARLVANLRQAVMLGMPQADTQQAVNLDDLPPLF